MNDFIVAIGLPASGKSTYGEMLRHQKCRRVVPIEIVSSDAIREEVFGDVNDQKHNGEVFNIMFQRSREALKNGKDVYYDATNLSAKRRMALIKQIRGTRDIPEVRFCCVIFATPYVGCVLRNEKRERVVPLYAMDRMYKSFQPPHQSEGWDSITLWGGDGEGRDALEMHLAGLTCVSHDNPHHSLSVGDHMLTADKIYRDEAHKGLVVNLSVIDLAIRYHDIGKKFCKTFVNAKGETTAVAHYYNHENVGAYLYLSHCDRERFSEDDLEIVNLIAHHMDFFKGEAYVEKIKKRFGEPFFSRLELVHYYDVNAH